MLEKYISARAQAHFARRREKLGAIATPQDATARQVEVRRLCAEITGVPPERAPLRITKIQTLERDGFNIEILAYQSLPGVIVTANLYLPLDRPAPYPGVVCIPGQWPDGKTRGDFQRLGRLLARRGIAALLIDLIGQGERLEFYDSTLRRSWVGKNVQDEWAHLGNPLSLTGRHLGAWLAWDAMRGLDVLIEHGGIDAKRLGISSAMGSENLGLLLCCQDERVRAAALAADLIENDSLGGDVQQNFFDAIPAGLVSLDLLVPFAPKPLLLHYAEPVKSGSSRDNAFGELRHWYGLLGKEEGLTSHCADALPGLTRNTQIRVEIVNFFGRAFGMSEERLRESETPPEPAETLYATETGQMSNSLNAVSVFGFHKRTARALPPPLEVPKDAAAAQALQTQVRARFTPHLRLPRTGAEVRSQVESHSNVWGYMVEKGRLEIDEGLYAPYSLSALPETDGRRALPTVLALHERGIAGVSNQAAWMTGFAAAGVNVVAIDVCGIGETRLQAAQETRLQSARETNEVAYDALLCGPESQWARRALNAGLSLFGLRVFSVLRTLAYLRTRPEVSPREISIVGVGRGGLWGLYAGALDGEVARVALLRSLATYKCLVEHRRHNHHFSLYLPGCLREFDLPHVAACVAPRPLTLINSVNQRKDRCDAAALKQDYALTQSIYKACGAAGKFQIAHADSAPETFDAVKAAIGAGGK